VLEIIKLKQLVLLLLVKVLRDAKLQLISFQEIKIK
jgi:hypothetical protein